MKQNFSNTYLIYSQAVLAIIALYFVNINNDVAWHLQVAEFILNGKTLYKDIIEINPPLIYYLRTIDVYISSILNLSPIIASKFITLSFCFISIYLCKKIIIENNSDYLKYLPSIAFTILILPLCMRINQFGQKEHLFIIMVMPYTISKIFAIKAQKNIRNIILLMASLGFCIKPFFLLWLATLQLATKNGKSLESTIICKDNIFIGLFGLIYILLAFIITPEYFGKIIPDLSLFYHYYRMPVDIYLIIKTISHLVIYVIPIGILYIYKDKISSSWAKMLLISIFIALIQLKGWQYHFYPAMVCAFITSTILIYNFIEKKKPTKTKRNIIIFIVSAVIGFLIIPITKGLFFTATEFSMYLFIGSALMVIWLFSEREEDIGKNNNLKEQYNASNNSLFKPLSASSFFIGSILYLLFNGVFNSVTNINSNFAFQLDDVVPYIKKHDNNEPVIILSEKLVHSFPAINYSNTKWGLSFSSLWLLTGIENYKTKYGNNADKDLLNKAEQFFIETIKNDIMNNKPSIILEDTQRGLLLHWHGKMISYLGFVGQDNEFKEFFKENYKFKEFITDLNNAPRFAVYYKKTKP